jgi:hypothetical protein
LSLALRGRVSCSAGVCSSPYEQCPVWHQRHGARGDDRASARFRPRPPEPAARLPCHVQHRTITNWVRFDKIATAGSAYYFLRNADEQPCAYTRCAEQGVGRDAVRRCYATRPKSSYCVQGSGDRQHPSQRDHYQKMLVLTFGGIIDAQMANMRINIVINDILKTLNKFDAQKKNGR